MIPHDTLKHLLTMDASEVRTAVDSNPDNLRRLLHSALQADTNLTPRVVPEDRGDLIYTVLTWKVNAHKDANPAGIATASPPHAQPAPIPEQQPPQLPTTDNRAGPSTARNSVARRQTPAPGTTDQRGPTLNDILASAPIAAGRSGPENPADPQAHMTPTMNMIWPTREPEIPTL